MINRSESVSKIRKVDQTDEQRNLRSNNVTEVVTSGMDRSDKGDLKAGKSNKDKKKAPILT